jgi:hypothetical protein
MCDVLCYLHSLFCVNIWKIMVIYYEVERTWKDGAMMLPVMAEFWGEIQ